MKMKAAVALFLFSLCLSLTAATINLSGPWSFQLDPDDRGVVSNFWEKPFDGAITLPGTTSQACKGNPLTRAPALENCSPENLNPKRGLTFGRNNSAVTNSPLA